jgi:hypothetical protein
LAPIATPSAARDTGERQGASASNAPAGATSDGSRKGAPFDPAGVSLTRRAANTPYVRDSILQSRMASIPSLAATRAPTGRERQELEQSQRAAVALRRRDLTAGNSRDLVILEGQGMNGVGAVGGQVAGGLGFGGSVPFTFLSSGPTREQRKLNEKIDADNQARLRRLEDRMYLKQDSVRADSIRADSLRRELLAKGRVVPEQ